MMSEEKDEGLQWSHLLVNRGFLDDVQQPILASSRIKYTSVSVSQKFIALGSSTGVVHVFLRESLRYVQLIAGDKDGSIVKIRIGPDEKAVGFATSKGMVYIYLLKVDRRGKPERLRSANDHRGAEVTCLTWNQGGSRLFIGDDLGKVTAANIISGAKDLFKTPSEIVMKLDKPIVQIDSLNDLILVSTTERTFIGNSAKQQYTHIGSKLRDGHFGACFWQPVTSGGDSMIYCSRPGSRIWEATTGGRVLNTHQFKALLAVPPLPMVNFDDVTEGFSMSTSDVAPQSITFPHLAVLGNRFLITVNEGGLYIFDPVEVKVILWNDELKDVSDWSSVQNTMYILNQEGQLQKIELMVIGKIVSKLFKVDKWKLAARLCLTFESTISCASSRHQVPVAMVTKLQEKMEDESNKELAQGLMELMPKLEDFLMPDSPMSSSESSRRSSASYEMTESGIYVVKNKQETPPLYSQKVFSFLNEAEKYLDKAFLSGAKDGLESDSVTSESQSNCDDDSFINRSTNQVILDGDLQNLNNNSASQEVSSHGLDSPEVKYGYAVTTDSDVVEATSLACDGNDESLKRPDYQVDQNGDVTFIVMAKEAQTIEDTPDEPAVILKKDPGRVKSKARKKKTARIVLEEDDSRGQTVNPDATPEIQTRKREDTDSAAVDCPDDINKNTKSEVLVTITGNQCEPVASNQLEVIKSNVKCPKDTTKDNAKHFVDDKVESHITTNTSDKVSVSMATKETPHVPEAVSLATKEKSPKRSLLQVKDKLSGTVKTKTKSLIQTIKDKKSQISPRILHKSSEDLRTLVFHKEGANDNYFIQEPVGGTVASQNTTDAEAYEAIDVLECPDIEAVTERTYANIHDLSCISDPGKMEGELSTWVNVMHKTLLWHRHNRQLIEDKTVESETVPLSLEGVELITDFGKNETSEMSDGHVTDFPMNDLDRCKLPPGGLVTDDVSTNESERDGPVTNNIERNKIARHEVTDDLEKDDLGRNDLEKDNLGQNDHEKDDLEKNDLEKVEFKQNDLDRNALGRNDVEKNGIESSNLEENILGKYNTVKNNHDEKYIERNELDDLQRSYPPAPDIESESFDLQTDDIQDHIIRDIDEDASQEIDVTASSEREVREVIISLNDSTCIPMTPELNETYSMLLCYCFEKDVYGKLENFTLKAQGSSNVDAEVFLKTYYHLLKCHFIRLWKGLQKKGKPSEKWRSLLACVKDALSDATEAIAEWLETSKHEIGPEVLVRLENLYERAPLEMIDLAARSLKNVVAVWEIIHIINSQNSLDKRQHLCLYLENYIQDDQREQRSYLLKEILLDLEMTLTWFQSLLLQVTPEGAEVYLKCSCGMPSPKANSVSWKSADLIMEILVTSPFSSQLMELCYKHGFWKGYLLLWSRVDRNNPKDRTEIFQIILHMNDLQTFDDFRELQPQTESEWRNVLKLLQQMKPNLEEPAIICLKCGSKLNFLNANNSQKLEIQQHHITFENLCTKMLDSLGPEKTLELLSECYSPSSGGGLSMEFYAKCVTAANVLSQQRNIAQEMVLKLRDLPDCSVKQEVISGKSRQEWDQGPSEFHYKLCGICGLEFKKAIHGTEHSGQKVCKFPCGHSFHDYCLDSCHTCPCL